MKQDFLKLFLHKWIPVFREVVKEKISSGAIVLLFALVFLFPIFFSCSPSNGDKTVKQKEVRFPVIDMHMHVFQWNKYGDPPPPNLISGKSPAARSNNEAVNAYLSQMGKYNIVLAVGSGQLEMVKMMCSRNHERFWGGTEFPRYTAPVNKRLQEWPDIDELRKLYKTGQLKIMGEISAQYAGMPLNDPRLEPYYALAEELDIPVCLHSGIGPPMSPYMGDPDFRMRYGNPLLLEDVLVKHPKLRVYIAHGGYPFIEETIALMLMYQQVYVDISAINWLLTRHEFHFVLKRLVHARLGKRIMFGSDQMIWPEAVGMSIEAVLSADFLSGQQKQDIFFYNAATFLRLDKSRYLPEANEYVDKSGARIITVVDSEIRMRPAKPGDKRTVPFNLRLKGATSMSVMVTGFDIDDVSETRMLINGQDIALPDKIVADVAPRTVTIKLDKGLLKEGENSISFIFANAFKGTNGFSILDVRLVLKK